ncbi:hypothetical protein FACS1894199_13990 [Bacteroidia bacterium]|nr:hypothetical protein FACS1894199_13990 [Bacteroidia bacterium]
MDVQQLYSARFESQKVLDRKNKIWQVLCKHFFQKHIPTDGVVLDIAAGYCEFINNIEAKKKIAFDLNPDVKRFANKDVQVFNESFFDMTKHLQGAQVDIIFASNILEHLDSKEQVIAAIRVCSEVLKSVKILNNVKIWGGKMLILQPNIKYAGAAYWDFIDHKVALTELALIEAGEMCGLKVSYCLRKFLPYTTKSKLPQHPFLIWLYLKLMPLSGFFMGAQSFLILEKTDE